jgi:hypothetical protein
MSLPQVVLNALASNEYTKREGLSATTLLKPPQMRVLQERHGDDDKLPMDMVWSILGTAVHNVFEKYAEEEALTEQNYHLDISGERIHGTVDHYVNGIISDFKITSAWKYVSGDFTEWEQQLNIYAYLMSDIHPVISLQIIAVFRDWSESQSIRAGDYPKDQIVVIPLRLWSREEQYEFISSRVRAHKAAELLEDSQLPSCSDKERWYTGTKYAVMKRGNKRAIKLYDDFDEASSHSNSESNLYIEERLGESKRCGKYCPVASKCQQWKKELESKVS